MPVFPAGVTPYTIRPPLTTGDDGQPSDSLWRDAQRVLDLIEDERHLTAQDLLHHVQERCQNAAATPSLTVDGGNQTSASSTREGSVSRSDTAAASSSTKKRSFLSSASSSLSNTKDSTRSSSRSQKLRRKGSAEESAVEQKDDAVANELAQVQALLEANQARFEKLEVCDVCELERVLLLLLYSLPHGEFT